MATQIVPPNPLHYISLAEAVQLINQIRTQIKAKGAKLMTEGGLKAHFGGQVSRGHILRTAFQSLLASERLAGFKKSTNFLHLTPPKKEKKPIK